MVVVNQLQSIFSQGPSARDKCATFPPGGKFLRVANVNYQCYAELNMKLLRRAVFVFVGILIGHLIFISIQ